MPENLTSLTLPPKSQVYVSLHVLPLPMGCAAWRGQLHEGMRGQREAEQRGGSEQLRVSSAASFSSYNSWRLQILLYWFLLAMCTSWRPQHLPRSLLLHNLSKGFPKPEKRPLLCYPVSFLLSFPYSKEKQIFIPNVLPSISQHKQKRWQRHKKSTTAVIFMPVHVTFFQNLHLVRILQHPKPKNQPCPQLWACILAAPTCAVLGIFTM